MTKKRIDLRELQMIEFEILSVFDSVCEEHGLTYYLAYGTLLGAVRHKGFIPWDDDIDLLMPRPDYEKLITLLSEGALPQEYSFGDLDDPSYIYPYMKIFKGNTSVLEKKLESPFNESLIWIDVFPMDGLPESPIKRAYTFMITQTLRNLLYTAIVRTDHLEGKERFGTILLKPVSRLIGPHRISLLIDRNARRYRYEKSNHAGNVVWAEGSKEAVDKTFFTPTVEILFEGKEFPAPERYQEHLHDQYGDYMQLPPEDQRASHLSSECYILL